MNRQQRYNLFVSHIARQFPATPAVEGSKLYCRRHAGVLASAGFGYSTEFDFRIELDTGYEQCSGYYIPDRQMIAQRLIQDLGYPESSLDGLVRIFELASTNFSDVGFRADFYDDLRGPRHLFVGSRERVNPAIFKRLITESIDDEDRPTRKRFWQFVRDDNPADYFDYAFKVPQDFPSSYHLQRTIRFSVVAAYDLDMGGDQEASFFGTNRQVAFRGSVRLRPSGRRGWHFPTCRLEDVPFRDERNEAELAGEPYAFPGEGLDDAAFEAGRMASWEKDPIPADKVHSLDWLAGYVMRGENCNASGHMSTGLVDRALVQAIDYAESLQLFDPLRIAIEGCRHLASTRNTRQLEEAIAEELDRRQPY
ncbi:hypothetical protein [Pseudomonas laurylsulfatiphila]|uniref:hypothetical protein n=1 Tax=Pseudomonas laurylsulfatiphila TaxID=2011015 RepID=UPI00215FA643|nr:hypothetical protein [Pseudomonas laurylsulfatiphila]UVM05085.1 hypothetical protein LOY25_29525 [Pseudomonas laurylsulfatiphila]